MFRFLKIVLGLLVVLIMVAVAVPFLVPADTVKEKVLTEIEARIGREISIDHVSFVIFPTLALDAEGVKIGNPLWAGGGNMIEAKSLKVGLELMPLLHKEYKIKEITLDEPTILLIQQKGRANWEFGKAETRDASPPPSASPEGEEQPKSKAHAALENMHVGRIAIKDGTLAFRDEVKGTTQNITSINFSLAAPELNEKAELAFSAVYEGKKADIALTLHKPFAFEIGSLTDVDLKASYGPLGFSWAGKASLKPGGRPFLSGKVTIPSLDVAALSQKDASSGSPAAAKAPAASPPSGASHWSDAPIKLDALARADADLAVSIGSLTLPKTTLKDINATVRLTQGVLQLQTNAINAYGGTIKLAASANTVGALSVFFAAAGAQAEPLLHDFASYDRVSGTITLETRLTAIGQSQRALVNSLGGSGSVSFKDGKLKGVNLPGMLRKLTGGQSADDGTDFSELSGTFTVAKGIITNNDFKMSSPLLRVSGAGTADLPNWQEHFLLKPMLVASLQGQGGKDASGITIPVRVEGPLDHPGYTPDFGAALKENLKDPAKLKQDLKDLKQQLKDSGGLKGLLR